MHFHLPKPLHGWREFVGEVGIIVVGVLIALGAEQAVETLQWRHKVSETTQSLRAEVAIHDFQVAEVVISAPCVDQQLQTLEKAVLKTGPYVPVPLYTSTGMQFAYRAPIRGWPDEMWQTAISDGVASHLDRELRQSLATHYAQIVTMREYERSADSLLWRMRVLAQPVQPDAAHRTALIEELEQARGVHSLMAIVGKQILSRVDEMKFAPSRRQLAQDLSESGTLNFCRAHGLPLGAIMADSSTADTNKTS